MTNNKMKVKVLIKRKGSLAFMCTNLDLAQTVASVTLNVYLIIKLASAPYT